MEKEKNTWLPVNFSFPPAYWLFVLFVRAMLHQMSKDESLKRWMLHSVMSLHLLLLLHDQLGETLEASVLLHRLITTLVKTEFTEVGN